MSSSTSLFERHILFNDHMSSETFGYLSQREGLRIHQCNKTTAGYRRAFLFYCHQAYEWDESQPRMDRSTFIGYIEQGILSCARYYSLVYTPDLYSNVTYVDSVTLWKRIDEQEAYPIYRRTTGLAMDLYFGHNLGSKTQLICIERLPTPLLPFKVVTIEYPHPNLDPMRSTAIIGYLAIISPVKNKQELSQSIVLEIIVKRDRSQLGCIRLVGYHQRKFWCGRYAYEAAKIGNRFIRLSKQTLVRLNLPQPNHERGQIIDLPRITRLKGLYEHTNFLALGYLDRYEAKQAHKVQLKSTREQRMIKKISQMEENLRKERAKKERQEAREKQRADKIEQSRRKRADQAMSRGSSQ